VLSTGVEEERPAVFLEVSLDVKGSVDLVLLPYLLMLIAPSAPGDIRSVGRGL
jgi:hypothetical protein